MKQQSKLTFNGFHIPYTIFDSYKFKPTEILMDKLIHLGFALLELSKFIMHETYYDKLQPYFTRENLQLHFFDYDSFVLSIATQNIIVDLKNREFLFDFTNLNENHELFSNEKKSFRWKKKFLLLKRFR